MKIKYSDEDIIKEIKRGNSEDVLLYLYKTTQHKLSNWIKKNNGSDTEAQDVFQDAVLSFYEYVLQDKFEIGQSVDGFIFTVGRNSWINRSKQKRRIDLDSNNLENHSSDFTNNEFNFDLDDKQRSKEMNAILERVGERCKELLTYSIFFNMTMTDIAEKMGFGNADTVKTKNYKCKKRLMKIINEDNGIKSYLFQ